jgi:lipopolysaccharide/colanic/teichoic acid biosynthesis glycosyltransferase/ADP-glucose pyrophosphorylase
VSVTKAVILAGDPGSARFPFANYYPKLGLPVANEPLLCHLVHHLLVAGVSEVAVSAGEHFALLKAMAGRVNRQCDLGVRVRVVKEPIPLGTAGALGNLRGFVGDSTVLVLTSSAFLPGYDLRGVVDRHRSSGAALTAVVERCGPRPASLENFKLDPDGRIREYIILHASRDRRDPARCLPGQHPERREHLCSAGIYVVDPEALAVIPERSGYMDINEQLLPALQRAGVPAKAMPVDGPLPKIIGLLQYFEANRRTLLLPGEDQDFVFRNSRQIGEKVWVGRDVEIADGARIVGPVLLGDRCHIAEGAEIVGPVAIGADGHVETGARVENSFLGVASRVGRMASVEGSLVAERGVVRKGERLRQGVVVNAKDLRGGISLVPLTHDDGFRVILRHGRFVPSIVNRRRFFFVVKRLVDLTASAAMLVVLSPVLAVIAAAIRISDGGPVIYSQERCGRGGRSFKMYKFRTMVVNAHEMQRELAAKKDVDGPMFKLENDPRVTRIGRFLRDTSLDELPQLVNVLKSEMSLVGPRPLVMEEMDFAPVWRDIRLQATPGITGLWQVNGRDKVSFHDWIKNDIRYVKEQSPALDAKILLSTFKVLRNGRRL